MGGSNGGMRAKVAQRVALVARELPCRRCGALQAAGQRYIRDPYPGEYREDTPPYVVYCAACITTHQAESIAAHRLESI